MIFKKKLKQVNIKKKIPPLFDMVLQWTLYCFEMEYSFISNKQQQ